MPFEEVQTTDHRHAAEQLAAALPEVPVLEPREIRTEYKSVKRSWRSRGLWHGSTDDAVEILARNLYDYYSRPHLDKFSVVIYSDQSCAQVNVHLGGPSRARPGVVYDRSFIGYRIWRAATETYLCGPREARLWIGYSPWRELLHRP